MSVDERAMILGTINLKPRGVSELIERLRWKPARVIGILTAMGEEGLIRFQERTSHRRGRPKKIPVPTSLGQEFLDAYKVLEMKRLRARRTDFQHAIEDASYTRRLIAAGHSPFKLFLELTDIVLNIKNSGETSNPL